ncbi:MAG: 50S ribosomal protein L31 [Mycoplasmataceae bacterium]|jgi:large subunit ribosomal protein L31|nr:50S ribosomal protein L31 [Mycoplasmataceae bacterium]
MNKKIQPTIHKVMFKCASCGATYEIESTLKQDTVNLDVCANCHPFYKGGVGEQKVKGRAEKLSGKFNTGKETLASKPVQKVTKAKKQNKKIIKSLDELK